MHYNQRGNNDGERAAYSEISGTTFGRLLYLNDPGMTPDQMEEFVSQLTPRPPLLEYQYRQGVRFGYYNSRQRAIRRLYDRYNYSGGHYSKNGRFIPNSGEYSPKLGPVPRRKEKAMPLVRTFTGQEKDEREPIWANASELSENDVIFTILNITFNAEKWFLEIEPRLDTADNNIDLMTKLDIDPDTQKLLMSFSKGSRDGDMQDAMNKVRTQGPLYNCYVECIPISQRRVFYDVSILPRQSKLWQEPPKRTAVDQATGQRVRHIPGMSDDEAATMNPRGTVRGRAQAAGQSNENGDGFDPFLDSDDLP